jgi:hypothetical protein
MAAVFSNWAECRSCLYLDSEEEECIGPRSIGLNSLYVYSMSFGQSIEIPDESFKLLLVNKCFLREKSIEVKERPNLFWKMNLGSGLCIRMHCRRGNLEVALVEIDTENELTPDVVELKEESWFRLLEMAEYVWSDFRKTGTIFNPLSLKKICQNNFDRFAQSSLQIDTWMFKTSADYLKFAATMRVLVPEWMTR